MRRLKSSGSCSDYSLHTVEQDVSEFFSSSAVTVQRARTKIVMKLMEEIRPHAIRLMDSWRFPDWQLDRSLGRYDGKVYRNKFERASEQNPLNGFMWIRILIAGFCSKRGK